MTSDPKPHCWEGSLAAGGRKYRNTCSVAEMRYLRFIVKGKVEADSVYVRYIINTVWKRNIHSILYVYSPYSTDCKITFCFLIILLLLLINIQLHLLQLSNFLFDSWSQISMKLNYEQRQHHGSVQYTEWRGFIPAEQNKQMFLLAATATLEKQS